MQRRTVLVAEDVDSNFLLLKTLLGKRCNLLWAKNGEDAVNQFKEHQPDLILMDIKMPHMDGLEATRLIRSYSKEVPIVALTAFAFEPDKDRAIEAGCDDCLTKPVSQNALEKCWINMLSRHWRGIVRKDNRQYGTEQGREDAMRRL